MTELISGFFEISGSVIVGLTTLLGVILQNAKANRDIEGKLKTAQAVTDTKLEELTREVREQNDLIKRLPVMENDIETLYHRINHPAPGLKN